MFLLIDIDGAYYDFYNVSTRNSVVSVVSSKSAQMTVEPLITNFAYFNGTPPKYSFDQIVGASNNIFVTKDYDPVNYTISEDIEPSNGWFEEGGRTLLRLTS
jgi:hypothetical protein